MQPSRERTDTKHIDMMTKYDVVPSKANPFTKPTFSVVAVIMDVGFPKFPQSHRILPLSQ